MELREMMFFGLAIIMVLEIAVRVWADRRDIKRNNELKENIDEVNKQITEQQKETQKVKSSLEKLHKFYSDRKQYS